MNYLIYVFISALLAGSAYLVTQNYWIFAAVLIIFIFYFILYFEDYRKKNLFIGTRYQECYQFINTFIIALSIKGSLIGSLEACQTNQSASLESELKGIEHIEIEERICYLTNYFPFYIYDMFLNIVSLHMEQGGDILSASKHLLRESRLIEEEHDKIYKMSIRKLGEIIVLWLLAIIILVVVRFALTQFYELIVSKLFFQISIGIFYLFILLSLHLSLHSIFKVRIKGFKGYEKVKRKRR